MFFRTQRWLISVSFLGALLLPAQELSQADLQHYNNLHAKLERGESLTREERAFAEAIQRRRFEEFLRKNPPRGSTGLVPLTDLGSALYKGEQGGSIPAVRTLRRRGIVAVASRPQARLRR